MNQAGAWPRPETGRFRKRDGNQDLRPPPWKIRPRQDSRPRKLVAVSSGRGDRHLYLPLIGRNSTGGGSHPDKMVELGPIPRWPTMTDLKKQKAHCPVCRKVTWHCFGVSAKGVHWWECC